MSITIAKTEYNAACDRIRTGRARPGDADACDRYEAAQPRGGGVSGPWYRLPVAEACWQGDAADTAS